MDRSPNSEPGTAGSGAPGVGAGTGHAAGESAPARAGKVRAAREARAGAEDEAARIARSRAGREAARLEREGPESFTACELASLVARARGASVVDSGALDWIALSRRSVRQLARDLAISRAAAARLCAAFELGRRVERFARAPRVPLRSPSLVFELMASELRGLERETFHALLLDGKHRLLARRRISEGTLTSSLVHPREVFAPAVRECAAAVIVVHNHPSGDPEPSPEDVAVTRRLIEAGAVLGIPLLDHVVVAGDRHVSLRERMRFDG